MSTNTNLPQQYLKPQPSLNERAFTVAFIPPAQPAESHLTQWSAQASVALSAIVEFRSACRRWQAAQDIPTDEYAAAMERLDAAGLADWLDDLLGVTL